jgi:hypothetical protein
MPREPNHKSGVINSKQRYLCKKCNYFFTLTKSAKNRRLLCYQGVAIVSGRAELPKSNIIRSPMSHQQLGEIVQHQKPSHANYHPTYRIFNHLELIVYKKKFTIGCRHDNNRTRRQVYAYKVGKVQGLAILLYTYIYQNFFLTKKVEFGTVEINHFY